MSEVNINNLSEEEILMVEMLTYLDEEVAEKAGVDFYKISSVDKGSKISDILSAFTDEAIVRLRGCSKAFGGAEMSGEEWAAILKYIKNNDKLSSLRLVDMYMDTHDYHVATDSNGKTYPYPLGLCFTDGENALVAFKGTTGPTEWKDNAYAATVVETDPQIAAYNFVDRVSQTYSNITVTGHSKGANKAMYSTIRCGNVERCVCFDGEGFSDKFLNAYSSEIMKRASKITNISLSSDFVHILLTQIPGSEQLYVNGYGVDGMAENHSPNSFFKQTNVYNDELISFLSEYAENSLGRRLAEDNLEEIYELALDKYGEYKLGSLKNSDFLELADNKPVFEYEAECKEVAKLHELAQYLVSHGRESEQIINYVGNLLPILILGKKLDGSDASVSDIRLAIFSDETALVKLIGRVLCFYEENDLDAHYIKDLLEAFHLNRITENLGSLAEWFIDELAKHTILEDDYDPDRRILNTAWDKLEDYLNPYMT